MYDKALQKALIDRSQQLLKQLPETENIDLVAARDLSDELRQVINFHDWRYYAQSEAVISDFEYDQLFKLLKKLEEHFPEVLTPDSPTQRVARGLTEGFPTVEHSVPMLSLDNSYNEEDLTDFDRRLRELTGQEELTYTVEPKFDGSSIALLYENDVLIRAATRGDGIYGEEITNNAKALRSIPLSAKFSQHGIHRIEVRGEVIIRQETFHQLNEKREESGLATFQNARNTAAGALRLKDSAEVSRRGLEAFIYQVGYAVDKDGNDLLGNKLPGQHKNIDLLQQLGFQTPTVETSVSGIEKVMKLCREWEAKRETFPYEIDGMVVKLDNIRLQQQAGATAHHPRWAIAFKFKAKQATTKLERVEFQVGRTGAVTPVAKLTPVPLAGVTISSVSLHNEDFILEKDIRINDTLIVERAGDVIPYIVGAVTDARTGNEQAVQFPTECPSCRSPLVRPEEESVWRCINVNCPAQQEERLIHFVSKGAMDIEGLGKDIVKRFISEGLIAQIPDIYRLDYDKILSLEGWKEKSVENLRKGVEASKNQPLWKLIVGLGIRHVGSATAKLLAEQVTYLPDLRTWDIEKLMELEDVGPKVAESIAEFFSNNANIQLIETLEQLGVNIRREQKQTVSQKLAGQSFLFTGTLEKFTRDQAKELVESNGGKTISSVSAKLSYLVVGASPGSKLAKAQKLGISVLSEDEFLQLING